MVFPIVRLFTLVQYKNGYWLCTGQERWWARLATCMYLWRFLLQQHIINDTFKKGGAGMWPFLNDVRLAGQIAFLTTFNTGMLWITHIKWDLITNNTATNYNLFIRIFFSIIDYINTLQTHLSWTCSYWIGALYTNISLYYIIVKYIPYCTILGTIQYLKIQCSPVLTNHSMVLISSFLWNL
jgi:hypothetical protein